MTECTITPELLLRAYCDGIFPMATGRSGTIEWFRAEPRAVLPLAPGRFHVRRSLAKVLRRGRFTFTRDRCFDTVIAACAAPRGDESDTWLNDELIELYRELHRLGYAHSLEAWLDEPQREGRTKGELVGGIYGVTIGGAFFGESMFSRISYGSQACLVELVEHLRGRGFTLFDVQFTNPHLEQFGVEELAHETYIRHLRSALAMAVRW
jgi:leucyl/phenylalanyl-tRNA--protein transferase